MFGGQGGIRTHGGVSPTTVFKTVALNHSATCPALQPPCRSDECKAMAATSGLWQEATMPVSFRVRAGAASVSLLWLPLPAAAAAQATETPVAAAAVPSPATTPQLAPGSDVLAPAPEPVTLALPPSPFQLWLAEYRTAAAARGLPAAWVEATLAGAVHRPDVVARDRSQPDDPNRRSSYASYLDSKLPTRIPLGRTMAADHRAILQQVAAASGVSAEILLAVWGIETFYGRVTGRFDLPSALASLAFDGRRAELFTGELDALVRIVGEGRVPRGALRGSWAGAFGQPQFLPSSYLRHGSDGDGDGRIDIVDSVPDTLASIARYLNANGWRAGEPWGFRTILPADFDRGGLANPAAPAACARPLSRHSLALPAAEWRRRGLIAINAPWPGDAVAMTLVEPDGAGAGAFLVTANFRAIMAYNCSNYYALSVTLLGDAVQAAVR
jgi:membrane-bound lytic murein transglycosylase B